MAGKIAENWPLGGGEIHLRQSIGDGLIRTPVEDTDVMAIEFWQKKHLQLKKVARYGLF